MELRSLNHFKKHGQGHGLAKRAHRVAFDLPTQVVNVSLIGRHMRLFSKVRSGG